MRWHQGIEVCERESWEPVRSARWNFEALMPCATKLDRIVADEKDPVPAWAYVAEGERGDLFEVSYLDLSSLAAKPGFDVNPEILLWEIRKYVTSETSSKLDKKQVLSHGGYPGREYWLHDKLGHRVFYRSYYADHTVYIIAVISRTTERPTSRHQRFLDSFAFLSTRQRGQVEAQVTAVANTLGGRKHVAAPPAPTVRTVAKTQPGGRKRVADPRLQQRASKPERARKMKRSAEAFLKRQKSTDWYNQ